MISDSDAIKAAVDRLTNASTEKVTRVDGTTFHAKVPSLWDQSCIVGASGASGRAGSSSDRSPIDLQLSAVRALIVRTTRVALRQRGVAPNTTVPAQLRQLAAFVLTWEPTQLWWWNYRLTNWADLLATLLVVGERRIPPVRLRNSACPECGCRQVVEETEDGDEVLPALAVDFRDGYVRSVSCVHCLATWWRGDGIHALAEALRVTELGRVVGV